ncbi:MAG: hypothetical protein WCO54_04995 [Bacteroidota bacterium]
MKIIEDIKNYTGRFILSRELSQKKVKRAFIPFADVQHIGIVYSADDKNEEEEVVNYANKLRSEGKKVFMMGYVDQKHLPHTKKFNMQSEFFWKEKLNGFNLPIKGKIGRFLDLDFDLLLNLHTGVSLPMQAIAAYSKAKYRMGSNITGGLDFYDAMIDTGNRKDLIFLIEQIDFYLKAIK